MSHGLQLWLSRFVTFSHTLMGKHLRAHHFHSPSSNAHGPLVRSTLAAKTDNGHVHSLPAAVELDCPEFSRSAERLRAAVGHTGLAYARLLDRLLYNSVGSSSSSSEDAAARHHLDMGVDKGAVGLPPRAAGALQAEAVPYHGPAVMAADSVQQQRSRATSGTSAPASRAHSTNRTVAAAARSAESLEHFHVFRRRGQSPAERSALEMHSDMGLFIVMTPAQLFKVTNTGQLVALAHERSGTGLRLELRDGRVVVPEVPEGCLLVMNGEGIERWMPAGAAKRVPYAPGHEVVLPDGDGQQGLVRAWFGRMYLPQRDATLQQPGGSEVGRAASATTASVSVSDMQPAGITSAGTTFGEYRRQAFSAFRTGHPEQASALGCSPTRRQVADEGSCGADEVFCWMVCMKTSYLPCGKEDLQCRNPAGMLWPTDFVNPDSGTTDHCYDCSMQCKGQPDLPSEDKASPQLCNANLTAISMFMQGFQTTHHNGGPCLVYLFPWLALTNWARFLLACLGTVAMGVCSAALGWFARVAQQRMPKKRAAGASPWPRFKSEALLTAVYALRIALAYFLMLLAMTYQLELFIMVVAGLTLGHYVFAVRTDEEEEENVDPCCC